MNHADVPGLIAVAPFVVVEVMYFGRPFRERPKSYFVGIAASLELILAFLIFRHFSNWGNVYF